jgi:aminopeptidase N
VKGLSEKGFARRGVTLVALLAAPFSLAPCPLSAGSASPDSLAALLGPGISLELARRRAATIRDVRYELRLDLTATDSAPGQVTVRFRRLGRDDAILDYRGRRLREVTANGRPLAPAGAWNGRRLRIPAALLQAGENAITLSFVSEIAPTGASLIRVKDPADQSTYLYTLLVPSDANQLFPCFDQPDLKARVRLELVWPRGWTALANGSLALADSSETTITGHFTETRPLPTYLIAFAAGPWERRMSTEQGRTINIFFRRSRAREVDADTLLALQQRALRWMEQYFGIPYPFEKYDLLLSPAFPFGGMEHPGVVMYNEDRFIFRERPTLTRRLGRFSTILHETAHQWFGDLVTMRWFDDLWLKEGFATSMGAKALAELEPASEAWKTFYQANKPAAYGVDQTAGTTPLWQRMGNLDQAKSAYGAIVYNKAPSVLKQLNFAVGDSAFQAGVRRFLTRHAYANATWQDLLQAIGAPAGFGAHFMLRPGMPIVETELTVRDGRIARLALRQRPAQPTLSGPSPWPMRTQVLLALPDGSARHIPVTLSGPVTVIPEARNLPAPRFVFPNAGDYGYFLSLLDSTSSRALETGGLAPVSDALLRTMLWGALWDAVRASRLDPARYTRLVLRELPREPDEQIVPSLLGRLGRALEAYLPPERSEPLRQEAEVLLWSLAADPARLYGIRRAALDALIGIAATPAGLTRLRSFLGADSAAGEPIRDPTRWNVVERLLVLDDSAGPGALAAQSARDTTPDGRRRAFTVGAARKDPRVKAEYFRRWFGDATLNEDWASGSLGAFNAIEHQALTLPYLRAALDSLPFIKANRRIFFLGSWLGAFLGGQTSAEALGIVQRYLVEHPRLDVDLRQKVLQNLDELERTVRIRSAPTT